MIGKTDRILHNGYELSCYLNKVSPKSVREKLPADVLCTAFHIYESGYQVGTVAAEGKFASGGVDADQLTDVISAAFDSGTENIVDIGYGFFAVGGDVRMFDGCVADWDMPIPVGGLILTNANWTSNNGMRRGRWLMSQQLNAGTTNGTTVDNLAATANGGLLHAQLENTDATGVSVRLQHSTNGSTWVDLAEADFGTRAGGGYTFGVNPSDTNTIIVNGVTFTFVTTASTATNINIKGSLALTMVEAAIVLNASVNASVSVATYTATSTGFTVSFDAPGTGGNAYTLDTVTGGNVTRTGATLTGGLDADAALHQAKSTTVAAGTTVNRDLRAVAIISGGNTVLVSAAFARG